MGVGCSFSRVTDTDIEYLIQNPDQIGPFLLNLPCEDCSDIDKAWHGIHFLLTGDAWEGPEPLCYLMKGGRDLYQSNDDPPRALSSEQVQQFSAALQQIGSGDLRERYDPKQMMSSLVYPKIWDRGEDELEYLISWYEHFKAFLVMTAQQQKGLIIRFG